MINSLLSYGVDKNWQDHGGCTALSIAARHGHDLATRALLHARVNVHLVDISGRTALMHAASRGNTNVVRMLMLYDADVSQVDHAGRSSLDYARECRQPAVTSILLQPCLARSRKQRRNTLADCMTIPDRSISLVDDEYSWMSQQQQLYVSLNKEIICDILERLEDFQKNSRPPARLTQ